jgi:hypothetical protein
MPNHCFNSLNITGPVKDVTAFVALVSGGKLDAFDFNTVVPMPSELVGTIKGTGENDNPELNEQLVKKHGFSNWYDWCIANWGTKWGAYDVGEWFHEGTCDGETATATITFTTAWEPPSNFLKRASVKFPALFFNIEFEIEDGVIGDVSFENGEIFSD